MKQFGCILLVLTLLLSACTRVEPTFNVVGITVVEGDTVTELEVQEVMQVEVIKQAELRVRFSDKVDQQSVSGLLVGAHVVDDYTLVAVLTPETASIVLPHNLKSHRRASLGSDYVFNVSLPRESMLAAIRVGTHRNDIEASFGRNLYKHVVEPYLSPFNQYTSENGHSQMHVYIISLVPDLFAFAVGDNFRSGSITEVSDQGISYVDEGGRTQTCSFRSFFYNMELCIDELMRTGKADARIQAVYSTDGTLLTAWVYYLKEGTVDAIVYQGDGAVEIYTDMQASTRFDPNRQMPTHRFSFPNIEQVGAEPFYQWLNSTTRAELSLDSFVAYFDLDNRLIGRDVPYKEVEEELQRLSTLISIGTEKKTINDALSERYAQYYVPRADDFSFNYMIYVLAGSRRLVSFEGSTDKFFTDSKLRLDNDLLKRSTAIRIEVIYSRAAVPLVCSAWVYYADVDNKINVLIYPSEGEPVVLYDLENQDYTSTDLLYPMEILPQGVLDYVGQSRFWEWVSATAPCHRTARVFRSCFGISEELWEELVTQ